MDLEHPSLIRYLVDQGFDIHEKGDYGKSSLKMALESKDESQRHELLAALDKTPPSTKIMSRGTLARTAFCSTNICLSVGKVSISM